MGRGLEGGLGDWDQETGELGTDRGERGRREQEREPGTYLYVRGELVEYPSDRNTHDQAILRFSTSSTHVGEKSVR